METYVISIRYSNEKRAWIAETYTTRAASQHDAEKMAKQKKEFISVCGDSKFMNKFLDKLKKFK